MSPLKKWTRAAQRANTAQDVRALERCVAAWESTDSPRHESLAPASLRCAALRLGSAWMWDQLPDEPLGRDHITAFWSYSHHRFASGLASVDNEAKLIGLWERVQPAFENIDNPWQDHFENFVHLQPNKRTLSARWLADLLPYAGNLDAPLVKQSATPLQVAFGADNFVWLESLLEAGANPAHVGTDGWSLVEGLKNTLEIDAADWRPIQLKVNQVLLNQALPEVSSTPRIRM